MDTVDHLLNELRKLNFNDISKLPLEHQPGIAEAIDNLEYALKKAKNEANKLEAQHD